jgi:hypothetical protein
MSADFEYKQRVALIRKAVSMPQVVSYYYPIPRSMMLRCPFHKDDTPSFYVYHDHAFCFGCRRNFDIFSFVMEKEGLSFLGAVRWLDERFEQLSQLRVVFTSSYLGGTSDYVPPRPEWQTYWASCLANGHRAWLRSERLLEDWVIDGLGIGWRPDWSAYSIPFWGKMPYASPVEVFQFRASDSSPHFYGAPWRYMGIKGHTRPSLVNSFVINPAVLIVFFGTLDAILAYQDGLPAISPNGAGVFLSRIDELAKRIGKVRKLLIVPDNSETEFVIAERYAEALGGEVRFFPPEHQKDYTDWRLAGRSVTQFVTEVLGLEGDMFIQDEHRPVLGSLVDAICKGDFVQAGDHLADLEVKGYHIAVINQALQLRLVSRPSDVLSAEEWETFVDTLSYAGGNQQLFWQRIREWCDFIESRLTGGGDF